MAESLVDQNQRMAGMTQPIQKSDHQRINATSGCVDYYTPKPIIEAARKTMGSIDLDPASSFEANNVVLASRYFTMLA